MRIAELTKDEHSYLLTNDMLPDSLLKWLEEKGLKRLGQGFFSAVFGRAGSDKVVKVNRREDQGYYKFVQYIKEHPCKFFPTIYDYKEMRIKRPEYDYIDDYYVLHLYITEKLQPINFKKAAKNPSNLGMMAFLHQYVEYASLRTALFDALTKDDPEARANADPDELFNQELERFYQTPEFEVISGLDYIGHIDIKADNIMFRPKDQTIVLSDPVF